MQMSVTSESRKGIIALGTGHHEGHHVNGWNQTPALLEEEHPLLLTAKSSLQSFLLFRVFWFGKGNIMTAEKMKKRTFRIRKSKQTQVVYTLNSSTRKTKAGSTESTCKLQASQEYSMRPCLRDGEVVTMRICCSLAFAVSFSSENIVSFPSVWWSSCIIC